MIAPTTMKLGKLVKAGGFRSAVGNSGGAVNLRKDEHPQQADNLQAHDPQSKAVAAKKVLRITWRGTFYPLEELKRDVV